MNIESITIVLTDGKIYAAKGFEEIVLPETIEVEVPKVESEVTTTAAPVEVVSETTATNENQ